MLKIDVDDSGLQMTVRGLDEGLSDLRGAWPGVHNVFTEFIKVHFASEGGYTGNKWVPLSPGYAAWKQKHYGGKGILHLTERLYPSLVEKGHAEHVYYEGPSFMETGTRVPYAWAHQAGREEINLPARTVIPGPTKAEGERYVDVILAWLFRKMRGR